MALPIWAQWDWTLCTTLFAMHGSKYVLAADTTLPQNITNSYVGVYKFLHFVFNIHPNYLTLTYEANGGYTFLLLHFKESSLMAN